MSRSLRIARDMESDVYKDLRRRGQNAITEHSRQARVVRHCFTYSLALPSLSSGQHGESLGEGNQHDAHWTRDRPTRKVVILWSVRCALSMILLRVRSSLCVLYGRACADMCFLVLLLLLREQRYPEPLLWSSEVVV
eukprot:scaffold188013_cov35-Tisochrysis_lutea.AAC.3